MTILPAAYLPSIAWFAALRRGDCVIDLGEHFVKRSERNRARIMTAAGVQELTAQVVRANRPRQPMRTVRLDYSKRWQHLHWGALTAAYKASPFFDHYAPRLEPFYTREYPLLAEFDLALTAVLCEAAGLSLPAVSQTYVEASSGDLDLRPKGVPCTEGDADAKGPVFRTEPYVQVFADRQPFVPNLSFVDLLFAEGPAAGAVLGRCRFE